MLPNRPLIDIDLRKFAKHIPHFRGIFMRDSLPKRPKLRENGILNLDTTSGTHWVAYHKNKQHKEYFDSFGNLQPPLELVKYLGSDIEYNYKQHQKYNSFNCGHLCLKFLYEINNK